MVYCFEKVGGDKNALNTNRNYKTAKAILNFKMVNADKKYLVKYSQTKSSMIRIFGD